MKHANVAIFVPHAGCENNCSFCNQHAIACIFKLPSEEDVINTCKDVYLDKGEFVKDAEIAFFGGSFTAIDSEYMKTLLESAFLCVQKYGFKGIRISTRPDKIDKEVLFLLKQNGVTSIELGAQSMCDDVLFKNNREHLASDVINASKLIKDAGFELGLQMMTGLFGSTYEKDIQTATQIIKIAPKTVRIYPTLTIKGTQLERLYNEGKYVPETLEESVVVCSKLLEMFIDANIDVIKLGLHSSTSLEKDLVAGPYHPSFRELCESRIYFNKIKLLLEKEQKGDYIVYVGKGCLSKTLGNRKENVEKLIKTGYNIKVKEKDGLKIFELYLEGMTPLVS